MASINGWVFVIVGLAMAGVTYFFVKDMILFAFIGAAFFVYGIGKIIVKKMMNKDEKPKEEKKYPPGYAPRYTKQYGEQVGGSYQQHDGQYGRQHNQQNMQNYGAGNQHQHVQHSMHNTAAQSHAHMQHTQTQHNPTHPHNYQQGAHTQEHAAGIHCRKCGSKGRLHDNFCSFCGTRLN